jgi:phosphatidylglycerophosphatase A
MNSDGFGRALATWFGCGYSPVAPGTVGSAAAVLLALLLDHYAGWQPWHIGVLGIVTVLPGIWASAVEARLSGKDDPGQVVIDEVAGQWITLAGAGVFNWKTYAAAFLLFRILDIWKPAPVRQLERLHGGVGIMADDCMAGIYGAVLLGLGRWLGIV